MVKYKMNATTSHQRRLTTNVDIPSSFDTQRGKHQKALYSKQGQFPTRPGRLAELPLEVAHVFVVDRRVAAGVLEQVEQAYGPAAVHAGHGSGEEARHWGIQTQGTGGSWGLGWWCPGYVTLRDLFDPSSSLTPPFGELRGRAHFARSIRIGIPPQISGAFSRDVAFESVILVVGDCDPCREVSGHCVCG
jgi:hypothetical protein